MNITPWQNTIQEIKGLIPKNIKRSQKATQDIKWLLLRILNHKMVAPKNIKSHPRNQMAAPSE